MGDNYQAVFDAVRSKMSFIDGSQIESEIVRKFDFSHHVEIVRQEFENVAYEWQRPSVLFRPALYIDGNHWCALYGKDLQNGIAGFGNTPAEAMVDFDKNFTKFEIEKKEELHRF